jgi:hypothetical protein
MPQAKQQGELLDQLQELLEQFASQRQEAAPAASGWARRRSTGPGEVLAVAVPVKVNTPSGKVRVYVSLPPETAASEDSLVDAIEALLDAWFPVDVWRDRDGRAGDRGGWRGRDRDYDRRRYR